MALCVCVGGGGRGGKAPQKFKGLGELRRLLYRVISLLVCTYEIYFNLSTPTGNRVRGLSLRKEKRIGSLCLSSK